MRTNQVKLVPELPTNYEPDFQGPCNPILNGPFRFPAKWPPNPSLHLVSLIKSPPFFLSSYLNWFNLSSLLQTQGMSIGVSVLCFSSMKKNNMVGSHLAPEDPTKCVHVAIKQTQQTQLGYTAGNVPWTFPSGTYTSGKSHQTVLPPLLKIYFSKWYQQGHTSRPLLGTDHPTRVVSISKCHWNW